MTARELVEILYAIAHNTNQPMEELEVMVEDAAGYLCCPVNYDTKEVNGKWVAVIEVC